MQNLHGVSADRYKKKKERRQDPAKKPSLGHSHCHRQDEGTGEINRCFAKWGTERKYRMNTTFQLHFVVSFPPC